MCLAKGITGGYLPLAATLASEEIYAGFLGSHEEFKTFFHGHTYTGNPLACAAALANLDVFEQERTLERLQPKIALLEGLLAEVAAMPEVAEVRQKGFMVGVDLGAARRRPADGPPGDGRGTQARSHHPPARQHDRPHAPALDQRERAARAGRDHSRVDPRGGRLALRPKNCPKQPDAW